MNRTAYLKGYMEKTSVSEDWLIRKLTGIDSIAKMLNEGKSVDEITKAVDILHSQPYQDRVAKIVDRIESTGKNKGIRQSMAPFFGDTGRTIHNTELPKTVNTYKENVPESVDSFWNRNKGIITKGSVGAAITVPAAAVLYNHSPAEGEQ